MSSQLYFIQNREEFVYRIDTKDTHDNIMSTIDWCRERFVWESYYWSIPRSASEIKSATYWFKNIESYIFLFEVRMTPSFKFQKEKHEFVYSVIAKGEDITYAIEWCDRYLHFDNWYWHDIGYKIGDTKIDQIKFYFKNRENYIIFILLRL